MPLHNKKDHMDCVYYATDESALFRQYRLSDSTDIVWKGPPFRWYLSLFKAVLPTIHYYILYRTSIFDCCFRRKEA